MLNTEPAVRPDPDQLSKVSMEKTVDKVASPKCIISLATFERDFIINI